jgi:predicted GNAT superfamily acetyltransferase
VAVAAAPGTGFAFRPLRKPEEFRHADELQQEALGAEGPLAVPAGVLKELQENGGLVLGAYADIYLAGLTASAIGWDGTTLYHHSLVTVVRPEYQKHRLGVRLKAFQREEVLRLGLAEVRWTVDPIHRAAASLAVRRLGARPDGYRSNYFGQVEAPGGPREESDRLHLRWALADPDVERRLAGRIPTPAEDLARHGRSFPIVRTETGESGLRLPTAVEEPSGASASLEIPFDLGSVRVHEPASVRVWRHAVRDGLRAAFDLGYRIDDVASVSLEHERRAFYFLSPAPPAPVTAGP